MDTVSKVKIERFVKFVLLRQGMDKQGIRCIECGRPIDRIFLTSKWNNDLKLAHCSDCGKAVDKYFECDNIHVTLDLLLLKASAFRHVLFNLPLKSGVLKMWVFMLFSDAYFKWWDESASSKVPRNGKYLDFSKLELQFYTILLQVLIQNLLFYFAMTILAFCVLSVFSFDCDVKTFLKALLFGKFAKLYVFAVYIWTESTEVSVCIMILECYIFICRYTFILCAASTKSKLSFLSLILLCICGSIEIYLDQVLIIPVNSILLKANNIMI